MDKNIKYMGKSNVMEVISYNNNHENSCLRKLMLTKNFDRVYRTCIFKYCMKKEKENESP